MCESRPGSRSVLSNIGARESDGHRLSTCNSNQMHVQPTPHLFLALFTAKIYQLLTLLTAGQLTAHDVLRAFMPPPAQFAACKQAPICGPISQNQFNDLREPEQWRVAVVAWSIVEGGRFASV